MLNNRLYVPYPPISYFPRNPDIPSMLNYGKYKIFGYNETSDTIKARVGQSLSSKKDSLEFSDGVGGKNNIINLPTPPYVNYNKWDGLRWNDYGDNILKDISPIQIFIEDATDSSESQIIKDNTNYFSKEVVMFSQEAASFDDDLSYFYDGEKLITNYDFSNPSDRERVTVGYYTLTDSIKVKAMMTSNNPGISFYTPSIDQYTLVVGKQRISE